MKTDIDPAYLEMMKTAGYRVHQRRSHMGIRWDFSAPGRGPMDARIFNSEEAAWRECQQHFELDVARAKLLLMTVGSMVLGPGYVVEKAGSIMRAVPAQANMLPWASIDENTPRERFLLLRGPSGYIGAPMRYIAARYEEGRAAEAIYNWRDHAGDAVTDGGPMPTEWVEL